MLTLYHAPKSRSFRTLWLLEEIGAPYEIKFMSIRRGDGGARDPANVHPHGKVPAIQHDGSVVFESTAIALYLTDAFPEAGLGPKIGESRRGAYVSLLAYYSGELEPSLTAKFLKIQHIYGTFGWAPFDDVAAYLRETLEARPYFLGTEFSAVDIVIGGSMPLLIGGGMLPDLPVFKDYTARIMARPAFARAKAKDAQGEVKDAG
jgi:glutathione S-transferase